MTSLDVPFLGNLEKFANFEFFLQNLQILVEKFLHSSLPSLNKSPLCV